MRSGVTAWLDHAPRVSACLLACLLAASLSACVGLSQGAYRCASTPASGGSSQPSTIAVLVDLTSQGPGASQVQQDRRHAMEQVLDAGFAQGSTLMVGAFGRPGDAKLTFGPKALTAAGNNPLECKLSQRSSREAAMKVLDQSSDGPADVLGGLAALSASLERPAGGPGPAVLILSGMLNNTDDLPRAALARDPDESLPALRAKGLLRDCSGWRVHVVGPGRTAAGGPAGTLFADLNRFWHRAFGTCGGELWGFQPQLTAFPASAALPAPPPFPKSCATLTLPAGIFFDTARADLRPDAGAAMAEMVAFVRANVAGNPSRVVQITGHTDADGLPAANQALSEQRAQQVAGRVAAQIAGLTIDAFGLGATQPVAPNDTPENKAKNRRVVVTVLC